MKNNALTICTVNAHAASLTLLIVRVEEGGESCRLPLNSTSSAIFIGLASGSRTKHFHYYVGRPFESDGDYRRVDESACSGARGQPASTRNGRQKVLKMLGTSFVTAHYPERYRRIKWNAFCSVCLRIFATVPMPIPQTGWLLLLQHPIHQAQ
jgi:hypothetical protein